MSRPKMELENLNDKITRHSRHHHPNEGIEDENDHVSLQCRLLPDGYLPAVTQEHDFGVREFSTCVGSGLLPGHIQDVAIAERSLVHKRHRMQRQRERRIYRKATGEIHPASIRQIRRHECHYEVRAANRRPPTNNQRWIRHFGDEAEQAITTAEYRHMAEFKKTDDWHSNLRKRYHHYARAIRSQPSLKTASFDQFLERLHNFWKYVHYLIGFTAHHNFLKWRFRNYGFKEKALDAITKWFVPVASPMVLCVVGDYSRMYGIRGNPVLPLKGLRKALIKRALVIPIHEYLTSKLCSNCYQSLEEARLLTTDSTTSETLLAKTRNVLCCPNRDCRVNFIERDVNAARNMHFLTWCKVLGLPRPAPFRHSSRRG